MEIEVTPYLSNIYLPRKSIKYTQELAIINPMRLLEIEANIIADKPMENIHKFLGVFSRNNENNANREGLGLENTL